MYSLTIHFGPNAMVWSFLFKEKIKAETAWKAAYQAVNDGVPGVAITDDFGQSAIINNVHGVMLEDMDLVMEARLYRSLENARGEIKAKQRASTDPVIRTAQQGPGVIAPNFGRN